MENKDEYLIYTSNDNTRFYYKNKKLHRKKGPAIVVFDDYDKYLKIGDEDLYQKSPTPVEPPKSDDFEVRCLPSGEFVVYQSPITYYYQSCFFIEGIEYSEKQFNAIILKEMLDKDLPTSEKDEKITKV